MTPGAEIDLPDVVAKARAVLDEYETALMSADTPVLDRIFWADPRTVRFGITENGFGHDAIRAFRATVRSYAQRVRQRVQVTTFGRDFACTTIVYERVGSGSIGRETKIMARFPDGWHVVSAHVSLLAATDPATSRG